MRDMVYIALILRNSPIDFLYFTRNPSMTKYNIMASIVQCVAALIVVSGLPIGLFILFSNHAFLHQLEYTSALMGHGFMVGLQNGLNETELELLAQKLSHTVLYGNMIFPEQPIEVG